MPFSNGVFRNTGGNNTAANARLMDQYARMAERGINVERERQSILEGMNRLERERLQIASRNFDRIRESTAQMRQQNQLLRESYSTTGLQARAMERVADLHRGITENLSLERIASRAIGVLWETQVARGMKLAAKIVADVPNDIARASEQTLNVTAAFRGLADETRQMAFQYNEDFMEINDLHNQILSTMRFTTAEIEAGASGADGIVKRFNQSLGVLTRMGILANDLKETLDFAQESAQLGHSYVETTGAIATTIKMIEKLAKNIRKGPNAELMQFDHILREKIIKDVRKLFVEFGGINTSVERLTALMINAGDRAQRMGATMAEAGELGRSVGNYFTNTRGRGDDMNFMEGEEMRVRLGLARYEGRGAARRAVENRRQVRDSQTGRMRRENDQEMIDRVIAANPELYGASVTDEQRRSRLALLVQAGHSNQQMTANIAATEEFGGTQLGAESIEETVRSIISGERGGGGPNVDPATQAEELMTRFGLRGRMQALMLQRMIANRSTTGELASMIQQGREAAQTSEVATDPVAQGQAIQNTSMGIASLVKMQNFAGKTMAENIDRMVGQLAGMASTMTPQGLFGRWFHMATGQTAEQPRSEAQRGHIDSSEEGARGAQQAIEHTTVGAQVTGEVDARSNTRKTSVDRGDNTAFMADYRGALRRAAQTHANNQSEGFSGSIASLTGIIPGAGATDSELDAYASGSGMFSQVGTQSAVQEMANREMLGLVRTRYGDEVARRVETLVQQAGGDPARIESAFQSASGIAAEIQGRGGVGRGATPAQPTAVPGGAPTPTAPPSAQQAAQTQNARQASLNNTAAGTTGTTGEGTLEPGPNGDTQLNMRINLRGVSNVMASNLAAAQNQALQNS